MYGCARVCMYVRACAYVCVGVGVSGDLVILISVDETQIEGRVDLVLCWVAQRCQVTGGDLLVQSEASLLSSTLTHGKGGDGANTSWLQRAERSGLDRDMIS